MEEGIRNCKGIYLTLIMFKLLMAQAVNKCICKEIKYEIVTGMQSTVWEM